MRPEPPAGQVSLEPNDQLAMLISKLECSLGAQIAALSAKVDDIAAKVEESSGSRAAPQVPTPWRSEEDVDHSLEKDREIRMRRRETLMAKFATEEVYGLQNSEELAPKKLTFFDFLREHALIMPTSWSRQAWDFVAILFGIYVAIFLPYRIAFMEEHIVLIAIFDVIIDCFFLCDIVLNFFTAYVDELGAVITARRRIARHYASTWLMPDLLSSIPWDWFFLGIHIAEDPSVAVDSDGTDTTEFGRFRQLLRVLKCIKLLRLLRITRVGRYLSRYLQKLAEALDITLLLNSNVLRLLGVCVMMTLFAHWNGCLQYLLAKLEAVEIIANGTRSYRFQDDSWVARLEVDGVLHYSNAWSWSFFTAVAQMLAISVGLREPQRTVELWGYLASIVCGSFIYGLFIASLTTVIAESDHSAKEYRFKLNMVNEYMKHVRLPAELRAQLRTYYELWFPSKRSFNEGRILAELSRPLRERMALHKCSSVLQALELMHSQRGSYEDRNKGLSQEGLREAISLNLQRVVFVANDLVIREGEDAEGMFFVSEGTAEIVRLADSTVLTILGKGSFFGEMALLDPEGKATASVRVRTWMDGYCLSRAAFEKLVSSYPSFRDYLQTVAHMRVKANRALSPHQRMASIRGRDFRRALTRQMTLSSMSIRKRISASTTLCNAARRSTIRKQTTQRKQTNTDDHSAKGCTMGAAVQSQRTAPSEKPVTV